MIPETTVKEKYLNITSQRKVVAVLQCVVLYTHIFECFLYNRSQSTQTVSVTNIA